MGLLAVRICARTVGKAIQECDRLMGTAFDQVDGSGAMQVVTAGEIVVKCVLKTTKPQPPRATVFLLFVENSHRDEICGYPHRLEEIISDAWRGVNSGIGTEWTQQGVDIQRSDSGRTMEWTKKRGSVYGLLDAPDPANCYWICYRTAVSLPVSVMK